MVQLRRNHNANDNTPLKKPLYRKKNTRPNPVITHLQALANSNARPASSHKTALAWSIPLLAVSFGLYAIWKALPLENLLWPSLIMSALLFFTTLRSETGSRLRNLSGLLMVAALTTWLAASLTQNGFSLLGLELALLVSLLALCVGWAFKSSPPVLLSTFMTLIYLSSYYPELGLMSGLTDQISLLGAGLLPWIILGQIILAQKLKSSIILLTSIVAGYIWFGTIVKTIPLSATMGLSFAVAATHYGLGKVWAESGKFGANVHRSLAWIIAIGSALYIQSYWLSTEAVQAKPFWPPSQLWLMILGLAMFTLFTTSMVRYKTSHISLLGIFIVCAAALIIPIATVKPDLIHNVFDTIPGLNARPGLGLIIGAIIIASGFIWLVQGLKQGQVFDMTLGAAAIGIEVLVLSQPVRFDADLGVIFIMSLICALCIGGLIAGSTSDRIHPRRTYA